MTANNPLISLDKVGYSIKEKTLVGDVSFDICTNEVVSLIGPNGAGKSTLVKLILGLIAPSTGKINRSCQQISYVPQKFVVPAILPLTVQDLLNFALPNRLSTTEQQAVFDLLDIKRLLKSQVATLSGGELQRALLAKAFLDKPDFLVLDEPMQGLDPEAKVSLYRLIDTLPDFLNCAMLVVSHDLNWVMKGTKKVICLNKHICCQGTPSTVAIDPKFIELFGQYQHEEHRFETPYLHHHDHCHHH